MARKLRLSFRREPRPTGLSAIARPNPDTIIKVDGLQIGRIVGPSSTNLGGSNHWSIRLAYKKEPTEKEPAPWKWMTLRRTATTGFETEAEAREFIQTIWVKRPEFKNSDFHYFEKD